MRRFSAYKVFLPLLFIGVFFAVPFVTQALSLSGMIISVVGFVLWVGAQMLDAAVVYLVLGMGGIITNSGGFNIGLGVSIDLVWRTVRDLVNLTFIFGLIYVGIQTVLGIGIDTKKLLSSIIIGALLVNFSLFMSKVIIDVSNITASEIYKQMGVGANATNTDIAHFSIADQFMMRMGILNLVAIPDPGTQGKIATLQGGNPLTTTDTSDGSIAFVVGASIFILVAAFIFAAGAILLVIRFGVLVILMMLSPVFFAATVFPAFRAYRSMWIHTLLSQAFFAPAFLFMIFVTLKVADGYQSQMGSFDQIFNNAADAPGKGFATAIFFCLTVVMMVASLIIAKKMGAYGANQLVSMGHTARRYGQRVIGASTLGAIAGLGRGTVGVRAYAASKSATLSKLSARKGIAGVAGRTLTSVANKGAAASFDARRVGEVGKKLGIGEGKKGGYAQRLKDVQKKETDRAKALGNDDRMYAAFGQEVVDKHKERVRLEDDIEEEYRKLAVATTDTQRAEIMTTITQKADRVRTLMNATTNSDYAAARDAVERALKREYAANLQSRGDNLIIGPKQIYRLFVRSKKENIEAATAIRKEFTKARPQGDTQAIIEALRENSQSS